MMKHAARHPDRVRRWVAVGLLAILSATGGCRRGETDAAGPAETAGEPAPPAAAGSAAPATPEPAAEEAEEAEPAAPAWVSGVPGKAGEWKQVEGVGADWNPETSVLEIPCSFPMAGLRWTGEPPSAPFEIELEARRTDGSDFFCGLTVPTRTTDECVTLIVGGWGGPIVGISSIDGLDASENQAMRMMEFENGRWYKIRLRFADENLAAWIDGEQVIDESTEGRRLSLRPGPIEVCAPFGLATWESGAEIRSIRWRSIPPER